MAKKGTVLLAFVSFVMIVFLMSSCFRKTQNPDLAINFIKESQNVDFNNWRNWLISYGSGKYIVDFNSDSLSKPLRMFFWEENDRTYVRLVMQDSISNRILIDSLIYNSIWNDKYHDVSIKDLKSHVMFINKYKVESSIYMDNPEKIIFKRFNDTNIYIYLLNIQDSILLGKEFKQINMNWYTFRR